MTDALQPIHGWLDERFAALVTETTHGDAEFAHNGRALRRLATYSGM